MNSLKFKILSLITVIVVLSVSGSAYVNFRLQKKFITRTAENDTRLLSQTIQSMIGNAMLSGKTDDVSATIAKICDIEHVRSLRIFSPEGKILNSTTPAEIGTSVSPSTLPLVRRAARGVVQTFDDTGTFCSLSPIRNAPVCHGCHDSGNEILGILETNISVDHMEMFFSRGKEVSAWSAVVTILLIIISISAFLLRYVDTPIRDIIASMQKIEGGDFSARTSVSSSREMSLLSHQFNLMTDKLADLMATTVRHERDLARAQEKLVHHHEMHVMNQKLEDQLKEIEQLNMSLRGRIDDIEEANYKIADLASELEDKNSHLEKAVGRLSTLHSVGMAINSIIENDKLLNLIVETIRETMNAQISYIVLYDAEHERLEISNIIGEGIDMPCGTEIPMKPSGVSTWVVDNRQPLLIADINEAPQFDRFSTLGYERKTIVCAPLIVKDDVIGTITAVNKTDSSRYTVEDLDLLTTIAAQASIAMQNARLYEEQQKTYLNTIHALVSAIEASDSYTRGHSERVTRFSLRLAKKLQLPPERLNIIERAAILHDIGKIGIDIALLHKQGKLTPEDVHDLQQHPVIGMKILEPIEFLHDVRLCIGQHHERFDGKGYPNRLSADDLLLESRILAIADSYDAMTSDRPYRKALPVSAAVQELIDNAGSQFDPELVHHFIDLLERDGLFSRRYYAETVAAAGA